MAKDRIRRISLSDTTEILVLRSSAHPVEYAIMLRVLRAGEWATVAIFDNAHATEEHHRHSYQGTVKQAPTVTTGPVNEAMHAALLHLHENWADIVRAWEKAR